MSQLDWGVLLLAVYLGWESSAWRRRVKKIEAKLEHHGL